MDREEQIDIETEPLIVPMNDSDNDSYSASSGSNIKSIDEAIETSGFGKFHIFMVIILGWANSADAIEVLSISYILPYAACELKASDLELGLLTAVGFAGMMIGAILWGSVADVKGRIKTLLMCQSINAIFTIASAATQSFWFLALMRLFSGIGVGGTNPLIFVYAVEVLPNRNRGRYVAVLSCFFMVGQILIAGLAWAIIPTNWSWSSGGFTFNNWRLFLLTSAIPVVSSVFLFLIFPESPRYLMQTRQTDAAKKALKYMHKVNYGGRLPYDDSYTIRLTCDDKDTTSVPNSVWQGVIQMLHKNKSLLTRRDVRGRLIYSSLIIFCLSFSYYGLTMWFPTLFSRMEDSNGQSVCEIKPSANQTAADPCDHSKQNEVYFDTFLQAISSLPGNALYYIFIDWIGRKLFLGVSMCLTGISVFSIWFVSTHAESIVVSCVYAGITVLSWNAFALVSTEIFPTELRSTAKGIQGGLFSRLGSILANLMFGALINSTCTFPLLVIACLSVIGGLITYKLPNTTHGAID